MIKKIRDGFWAYYITYHYLRKYVNFPPDIIIIMFFFFINFLIIKILLLSTRYENHKKNMSFVISTDESKISYNN